MSEVLRRPGSDDRGIRVFGVPQTPASVGHWDDAAVWFEKALARNPDLGDAWFHLALTSMPMEPKDRPRPIAAAKAAKKAGHPGAEELLGDLEAEQA